MATVTDLNGNQNSVSDNKTTDLPSDSNVNVFEFGNLILADIFPSLSWLINQISDAKGNELTAVDSSGNELTVTDEYISNTAVYDSSIHTYEDSSMNYDGYPLQGVVVDMDGS